LKYRGEKPPVVTISARRVGPDWSFALTDNGIGIDPAYHDRIFSMFQRLHGRAAYEGTGMGLAICRKVVERHGGNITAKSVPGRGATFMVTLPVKQFKGNQ